MMSAAPLGALAEVILEQYGELIEAAIEDASRRRTPLAARDYVITPEMRAMRFRSEELAEMHIQPGNWVAVGCIGDVHPRTLVEINLSTWKWRETLELAEPRETPLPHGQEIPPAPRQAAS